MKNPTLGSVFLMGKSPLTCYNNYIYITELVSAGVTCDRDLRHGCHGFFIMNCI